MRDDNRQLSINLDPSTANIPPTIVMINSEHTNSQDPHENQDEMIDMLRTYMNRSKGDFWPVESDVLHNWKYYFPLFNPDNLEKRFKKKKKSIFEF
jgi:hypothetical protein